VFVFSQQSQSNWISPFVVWKKYINVKMQRDKCIYLMETKVVSKNFITDRIISDGDQAGFRTYTPDRIIFLWYQNDKWGRNVVDLYVKVPFEITFVKCVRQKKICVYFHIPTEKGGCVFTWLREFAMCCMQQILNIWFVWTIWHKFNFQ